ANVVAAMVRTARHGKSIRGVAGALTPPPYTRARAEGIARLVAVNPPGGVSPLPGGVACSWYAFARQIFAFCELTPTLAPTASAEFGAPACRPSPNGVLANTRAVALGVPPLRPWPEALKAYLTEKKHLAG